jgi:cell division septal protein FtsQ
MAREQKYYSSKKYRYLKKKKSIFRNRFFWFFILGIITFLGLFYFLIFSPVFQIESVTVEGTHFVDALEVKEGIEKITEKNILFFPSKSIFVLRKREVKNFVLENFFPVKDILVEKKLLHKLSINIEEKKAKALSCSEEECFLTDNQGFAFQTIAKETAQKDLPIIFFEHKIIQKDKLLDQELLEFISLIYAELKERGNIAIQEFKVFPSKVEARTENNLILYFSPQKSPPLQVEDLILFLRDEALSEIDELEYIDLRFDKIFYK